LNELAILRLVLLAQLSDMLAKTKRPSTITIEERRNFAPNLYGWQAELLVAKDRIIVYKEAVRLD
jgi:hypothetical protein